MDPAMNVRMRPSRWAGLFLVFACSCAPLGQPVERRTPPGKLAPDRSADDDKRAGAPAAAGEDVVLERARAIAHRYIIVDGHVDLPLRLHASRDAQGTITEDITQLTARGCFDWPRARQGGLSAPFMSIYIPVSYQDNGAKRVADSLIDIVEGLVARAPDKFALARAPADVERNFGLGRMSLPMGMENGAGLEGRLENLEHFYRRGIRYITLAHAKDNDICDSASGGADSR